jgi:hypothetical protein
LCLLTLGSIGLALEIWTKKCKKKNYTEESIRGGTQQAILFGYGIGKYSIDRFSILSQAYSDSFGNLHCLRIILKFVILAPEERWKAWRRRQMISDSIVPVVLCRRFIIWGRTRYYSHVQKLRAVWPPPRFSQIIDSRLKTLLWNVYSPSRRCRKPMYISTDGRTVHVNGFSRPHPNITNIHFWFLNRNIFFCCTQGITHMHSSSEISQFDVGANTTHKHSLRQPKWSHSTKVSTQLIALRRNTSLTF